MPRSLLRWAPGLSAALLLGGGALAARQAAAAGPPGLPEPLLHACFAVLCALLVAPYLVARRGGRPLLRALALLTLVAGVTTYALLLLELQAHAHGAVAVCHGLAGLLLLLHWLVLPSQRPGPAAAADSAAQKGAQQVSSHGVLDPGRMLQSEHGSQAATPGGARPPGLA